MFSNVSKLSRGPYKYLLAIFLLNIYLLWRQFSAVRHKNPHDYNYLSNPGSKICGSDPVSILILVTSGQIGSKHQKRCHQFIIILRFETRRSKGSHQTDLGSLKQYGKVFLYKLLLNFLGERDILLIDIEYWIRTHSLYNHMVFGKIFIAYMHLKSKFAFVFYSCIKDFCINPDNFF